MSSDTITCANCKYVHNIRRQTLGERDLMRVMFEHCHHTTYFCDLLCCLRYQNRSHPYGYKATYKNNIDNYYRLQEEHKNTWRPIPWLEKAHEQSVYNKPLDLVYIEDEEQVKNDYINNRKLHFAIMNAKKFADENENDQ